MSLYYPSTSQGIQVDKIKYLDLARPEGFEPPTYGFEVRSNSDRDII